VTKNNFVSIYIVSFFLLLLFAGHCSALTASDEKFLETIQIKTLNYFVKCVNPENGLLLDRADNFAPPDLSYSPCSVAGVGFGLTAIAVGVERGWLEREFAERLTLTTLEFFFEKMENVNGFFYHFVDMKTGKRVWNCEVSSIDTALFVAGAIFAGEYYDNLKIKRLASALYYRVNWRWMTNGRKHLCMGWKPEEGFLSNYWSEYCESMIMYLLAMGSPTYPVGREFWDDIDRPYGDYSSFAHIYCAPLFTHQYSHIWIDFSNKRDDYADYFYNSKMATLANRQYCLDNARDYPAFTGGAFGLTACIGPDGYLAYGAPPAPAVNDGTLAPTAAGGSIIFTPEESIAALRHIYEKYGPKMWGEYGFCDSFNPGRNWFAQDAYAINQGPIILMIENLRSGMVHRVFMKNSRVKRAMELAKFRESDGFKHDRAKLKTYSNRVYFLRERPTYVSGRVDESYGAEVSCLGSKIWNESCTPEIILDKGFIQSGINKQPGFRVEAGIVDNSGFLFIRCRVRDSEIVSRAPFNEMYRDDAIEIFLDPGNDKIQWGSAGDFQIILSPGHSAGESRVNEFFSKGSKNRYITHSFKRDDTGYEFILALDKRGFNIKPGSCGFSIAAHNVDEKLGSECKFNSYFLEPGIIPGILKLSK